MVAIEADPDDSFARHPNVWDIEATQQGRKRVPRGRPTPPPILRLGDDSLPKDLALLTEDMVFSCSWVMGVYTWCWWWRTPGSVEGFGRAAVDG